MVMIDSTKMDEAGLGEVWSVHAFARQYRLDRMEESRLKMLYGRYAEMRELLSALRRTSSVW